MNSSGWGCVLKAVYSRSLQSAEKLAENIPATVEKIKREYEKVPDVDIYSDDSGLGKGYRDLLARDDIMAVTIAYVCHVFSVFEVANLLKSPDYDPAGVYKTGYPGGKTCFLRETYRQRRCYGD